MQFMKVEKQADNRVLETEINGHKVVMHFAGKPDPEIAERIKLALLGSTVQEPDETP